MPKFIINQTRTEEYQAEVEADTEAEVWEALQNGELSLDFLVSDDEFVVYAKENTQNG